LQKFSRFKNIFAEVLEVQEHFCRSFRGSRAFLQEILR